MNDIEQQLHQIWEGFLDSVVNADIKRFSSYFSETDYLSHMGGGLLEASPEAYFATIAETFEQTTITGDPDSLQQRNSTMEVLNDNLVLCQHTCFLRDANAHYGITALFKLTGEGWKIIHTHDSFGMV